MGYRLTVYEYPNPDIVFYGTKLYGYFDNDELKSKKFLQSIDPDYDTEASYWEGDPQFLLSASDFRKFIELYSDDWYRMYGCKIDDYDGWDAVKEILESENPKIIEWR